LEFFLRRLYRMVYNALKARCIHNILHVYYFFYHRNQELKGYIIIDFFFNIKRTKYLLLKICFTFFRLWNYHNTLEPTATPIFGAAWCASSMSEKRFAFIWTNKLPKVVITNGGTKLWVINIWWQQWASLNEQCIY